MNDEKVIKHTNVSFTMGVLPDHLSEAHICLIPKKSKPETMGDLRPVALCNVNYKILSKVMANRLKGVLSHVISYPHSAFVLGCQGTSYSIISRC